MKQETPDPAFFSLETSVPSTALISVIVPAYNEAEVLPEFHRRLSQTLSGLDLDSEIIYVNDGSRDATVVILHALQRNDPRVTIVDLSRNFGKEIAMTAGIDHASGDAVVVIDADLQDPPELIHELVRHWRDGYDDVYAKRASRDGESLMKRATAHLFYRLLHALSNVDIPPDTGDYRLLSRRAVDSLKQLKEQHRFMKGLFNWVGFERKEVLYKRDPRSAGKSKWNYWRLWNFALEGITSHSTAPLRLASYLGFFVAFCAFVYALYMAYDKLAHGNAVAGYPSLIVTMLFLGGIQLITLGIIGEYLGRMFDESKRRPLYFIKNYVPAPAVKKHDRRISDIPETYLSPLP
ncbi:glycosyl transferase family 2 [Ferrigenium kumadai]|uniref:Glycosyl transferase family 2 n=1 Tax=Ferrigenium kumadai TaxID=1682490 RepID=A0AAN1W0M8_9PROT|nr:glycosyltransferase family 2 protein [Ferrigenium kumadai]BBI99786.1 glycosyl transferase family 2 [Ferrigenium kumadai]